MVFIFSDLRPAVFFSVQEPLHNTNNQEKSVSVLLLGPLLNLGNSFTFLPVLWSTTEIPQYVNTAFKLNSTKITLVCRFLFFSPVKLFQHSCVSLRDLSRCNSEMCMRVNWKPQNLGFIKFYRSSVSFMLFLLEIFGSFDHSFSSQ